MVLSFLLIECAQFNGTFPYLIECFDMFQSNFISFSVTVCPVCIDKMDPLCLPFTCLGYTCMCLCMPVYVCACVYTLVCVCALWGWAV